MAISSPSGLSLSDAVDAVLGRRELPTATYRIQFNREFSFRDALAIVPYLADLGVSTLYASPCLKPGRDSSHGYDICDHNRLNPALGSDADFDELAAALRARGMGLIFDVVPNHMGIVDPDNAWWYDVLENGPSSPYATYFDIDWHPLKADASYENRLLLPGLGDPYGKVLENGELVLNYQDGAFFISYYNRRMPISPRTYPEILGARLDALAAELGAEDARIQELQSIITAANHLPPETATELEAVAERQREKEIIKRRIATLAGESPEIRAAIEATVREFNGTSGDRHSFDALDALLEKQCYRVSFWRVAAEEINYRRFFDVNDLAAIRMELPQVFDESHRLILRLVRDGKVTGLRVDHADGLWDPRGYLDQLQTAAFLALAGEWIDQSVDDPEQRQAAEADLAAQYAAARARGDCPELEKPLYLVVEKILGKGEALPASWPIHGTTGYDFSQTLNGLFVDAANRKAFNTLYLSFVGHRPTAFPDLVNSSKKMIMLISLASEVNELAFSLKRIARRHRWYRDLTVNSLTHAVREIIAALPIYRTYLTEEGRADGHDRSAIEAAIGEAKRRNPRTARTVFDFIRRVLLLDYLDDLTDEDRAEWRTFVMRFQQTSGPVMAKGVEDTAFYVYNRLLSLNEVGGDPEQFGVSPLVFHFQNQERVRTWPRSMLAGSTHDSKRSADVRARLNVLSELPKRWRAVLGTWSRQNRTKKSLVEGQPAPDRNDEYFIYQTLLGAWPLEPFTPESAEEFRRRIQEYVQKAMHEAKVHTSWVNPNAEYDDALAQFVDKLLTSRPGRGFLASFLPFQQFVAFYGMLNALSQTLLQLTSPGVPDLYQGSELWDLSLVDPDNRRPVDYATRLARLADLRMKVQAAEARPVQRIVRSFYDRTAPAEPPLVPLVRDLLANWTDGQVKLYLIRRVLAERRAHPDAFTIGAYRPLEPDGPGKEHLVGIARSDGAMEYLTLVPRLGVSLTRGDQTLPLGYATWEDTVAAIPEGVAEATYENVLTGERVVARESNGRVVLTLAEVFATCPVAFLRRSIV
ncbi:MAG TPA: malto-oligosyltrehalose synthase [Chloroflexota bacterium]|nr:malto-oligosyltrehalose synthase [Chloroflexota bacterium]